MWRFKMWKYFIWKVWCSCVYIFYWPVSWLLHIMVIPLGRFDGLILPLQICPDWNQLDLVNAFQILSLFNRHIILVNDNLDMKNWLHWGKIKLCSFFFNSTYPSVSTWSIKICVYMCTRSLQMCLWSGIMVEWKDLTNEF